jgi:hypothetical protein
MRWLVGIVFLASLGHALADDQGIGSLEEWETNQAVKAYDRVTIRFNTHIKAFSSWDAFKAEVLSRVPAGTSGSCYASTGDWSAPIEVMKGKRLEVEDTGWQQTSGQGWRRYKTKRAFIEYRVNTKADVLLRAEGVKSGFFFTHIQRICEFPL